MKKVKNIFKEFFLLMLMLTAITLVLAIILYGYNPTNKIVPTKISYTTPENINAEIESVADSQTSTPVTITYELDETHINNSKQAGSYNSGKNNPFAKLEAENADGTQEGNSEAENNGKNNNKDTSNNTSEKNNSSTKNNGTSYLPSTGGK